MEGGEKDFFPSLPKGNQTWNIQRAIKLEPSIGHQARCFPIDLQALDSFQGPPNLEPSINNQVGVFLHFLLSPSL
jgi:hypothetical protein